MLNQELFKSVESKTNENFSFVFSPGDGTYYAIFVKRSEERAYNVRWVMVTMYYTFNLRPEKYKDFDVSGEIH